MSIHDGKYSNADMIVWLSPFILLMVVMWASLAGRDKQEDATVTMDGAGKIENVDSLAYYRQQIARRDSIISNMKTHNR